MKILFVGNSYTYFNKMPETLAAIAAAEGLSWQVDSVTRGGWYLSRYADPENETHAPLAAKLREAWDAVILQEQSCCPAADRPHFLDGVRGVCAMMDPKPERIIMYVTWGRADGCPKLEELGMTRLSMTAALRDAYAEAADLCGASLSDVGGAFAYVCAHRPDVKLYNSDLSHPSPAGSYLAALMHFAALTGDLPKEVRYLPQDVSAETAEQILHALEAFRGSNGHKRGNFKKFFIFLKFPLDKSA